MVKLEQFTKRSRIEATPHAVYDWHARPGALGRMLRPFQWGLGGRIGSGEQYYSWIGIDDVLGAIYHALMCPELRGPSNVVSPQPVTMRDFARTLGRVLGKRSRALILGFLLTPGRSHLQSTGSTG